MDIWREPNPNPEHDLVIKEAIEAAADNDIYLEVGCKHNADMDCLDYYAMALPTYIHDALLEKTLGDYIRHNDSASLSPLVLPQYPIMPLTRLPQELFETQPTYVEGYEHPADAIAAALAALEASDLS